MAPGLSGGVPRAEVIRNHFISIVIYIPPLLLSTHLHSPNRDPHLPLYFRPDGTTANSSGRQTLKAF